MYDKMKEKRGEHVSSQKKKKKTFSSSPNGPNSLLLTELEQKTKMNLTECRMHHHGGFLVSGSSVFI